MALALVGLALTSCKSGNTDANATDTDSTAATAENNGPKTDTIYIRQMQFQPNNLTISKGDKVVWVNKGIVAHDVTEGDPANASASKWTSDSIQVNAQWEKVPDESFDYFCSIHPTMKASITVK